MKFNLSIKPKWLIRLLKTHQNHIHLNGQGLTCARSGLHRSFPWQEISALPVLDRGFFSAALVWRHQGKVYRFSWFKKPLAEKVLTQASQAWCHVHGHKLVRAADHCCRLLYPNKKKCYLRHQSWLNIKACAQTALAPWPEFMPKALLTDAQQQAFHHLQQLSRWSESDLEQYRQAYIGQQQSRYADFFCRVESNPLTTQQQIACISDEHNNLVLAGAGTGKTSVMVGRTGYLLQSKQTGPGEILLLAFGNKAAKEMDERIKQRLDREDIRASTFHALGQAIISKVEGRPPQLTPLAQDETAKQFWLEQQLQQLLTGQGADHDYPALILSYLERYRYPRHSAFDFTTLAQHIDYLKDNKILSLAGDKVHSYGELLIADYLYKTGIHYRYRQHYCVDQTGTAAAPSAVKTPDSRPYKPAFYLPAYDIVIEFRHLKADGETPPFINRSDYHQQIAWQRRLHKSTDTRLIELDENLLTGAKLTRTLAQQLKKYAVPLTPADDQSLLAKFADNGDLAKLGQLLARTLTLYKAGGFDKTRLDKHLKTFYAAKPEAIERGGPEQINLTLQLLAPLYQAYQAMLAKEGQIDFDDMIAKATAYVSSGQFTCPWRYIMVDEFQDISVPRARLIKALRDAVSGASLFCVGDDWQAIYRFAGSDVSLTRHFAAYFGQTCVTTLDKTFRFNNSICDIASRFVSRNPAQLTKKLTTLDRVKAPAITLMPLALTGPFDITSCQKLSNNLFSPLADILKGIGLAQAKSDKKRPSSVLLLARYHHLLPDKHTLASLAQQFPALAIKGLSIHASKGMEADIVFVLGLHQGNHGFPAEKSEPLLIDALLPLEGNDSQSPAHAEERRLFYVALTRAKDHVYLLADQQKPSEFIRELLTDQYPINKEAADSYGLSAAWTEKTGQNGSASSQTNCRVCKTGVLTARSGRYGNFYGCSNYPYCEHHEEAGDNGPQPSSENRQQHKAAAKKVVPS
ncbi:UvrD-helicase domain-containing protein [Thalassomonas actiniarum]|uniref:DNA 3'-5' helicase n=1 Tax=Thalassomonas actiniarum TaxID=485447 RepID=A0AAE9YMS5_9GAMM|nr:UvrD-helicase domain-containing protein [Thalassomonas actiniarum]WDD97049.1 UvrD-helicase domain-containing protein [Thalassomonas actiniarum]